MKKSFKIIVANRKNRTIYVYNALAIILTILIIYYSFKGVIISYDAGVLRNHYLLQLTSLLLDLIHFIIVIMFIVNSILLARYIKTKKWLVISLLIGLLYLAILYPSVFIIGSGFK